MPMLPKIASLFMAVCVPVVDRSISSSSLLCEVDVPFPYAPDISNISAGYQRTQSAALAEEQMGDIYLRRSDREYDKLVEGASFADAAGIHSSRGEGPRSSREALRNMFSQYAFQRLQLRRKEPRVNIFWGSGALEKEAESEEGGCLLRIVFTCLSRQTDCRRYSIPSKAEKGTSLVTSQRIGIEPLASLAPSRNNGTLA